MTIRGIVTFATVVVMAGVGLAMTSANNASGWHAARVDAEAQDGPRGRGFGPPPGRPGEGRGGIGRELFELDLTAAQMEQVKELMLAEREAGAPYHEALRTINQQMRQAVESGEFDEPAVRALAAKEAAATTELRVIGAKTRSAIYRLLTDEQKKALAETRDDQPPPRGRRGNGGRGQAASAALKGGA